jgi:hypothetical protein
MADATYFNLLAVDGRRGLWGGFLFWFLSFGWFVVHCDSIIIDLFIDIYNFRVPYISL